MDELIQVVQNKTGLPEEQARKAAEAVVDFLKAKAPPPVASAIDGLIGDGGSGGLMGKASGMLGGLMGGK